MNVTYFALIMEDKGPVLARKCHLSIERRKFVQLYRVAVDIDRLPPYPGISPLQVVAILSASSTLPTPWLLES